MSAQSVAAVIYYMHKEKFLLWIITDDNDDDEICSRTERQFCIQCIELVLNFLLINSDSLERERKGIKIIKSVAQKCVSQAIIHKMHFHQHRLKIKLIIFRIFSNQTLVK